MDGYESQISPQAYIGTARRLYDRYTKSPGAMLDMVSTTQIIGLLLEAWEAQIAERKGDGR